MPHFNAHSQEDPSQDSAGSSYKCLDQRPHCSRYIKIGNWAGQISPFIVFRVIAGCCDALRFMAPRDNSRFKFFFSSLRLLDITYFYPFPLLLELIRWTTTHHLVHPQVKSVWRREGCEIQVKWEQPAGNLWLSKFVTCHCNLKDWHKIWLGRKQWSSKLTTFVC